MITKKKDEHFFLQLSKIIFYAAICVMYQFFPLIICIFCTIYIPSVPTFVTLPVTKPTEESESPLCLILKRENKGRG